MKDMRLTPADKQDAYEAMSVPMQTADYSPGLSISLNCADCEKLDIEEDCEVGDLLPFSAIAKVTSISAREVNGATEKRIELQIIGMEFNEDHAEPDADDA